MAIRFASLGSGSKGNGTLVESGDTCVLVDCGFSIRETERRLARLGRSPADLQGVLLTHEHTDHSRGVLPLARKYRLPLIASHGSLGAVAGDGVMEAREIRDRQPFVIGGLVVEPVTVPHDAREPLQFIFVANGRRVGILTDLGAITPHVVSHFGGCDGLLLEANHDVEMLRDGPYPPALKRRVGGSWGHLNNHQSAQLLAQMDRSRLQTLVLGHISQQNNAQGRVAEAVAPFARDIPNLHYACQDQGFDWQVVE